MKPYLLPTATALIGFSLAWVAKPSSQAPVAASPTAQSAPVRTSPRSQPNPRDSKGPTQQPTEVKATDFPLYDQAQAGPKSAEEAKMMRLTEALDLAVDQQGAILQLVGDVQNSANADLSAIEDLTVRGQAIEDGLKQILTPEQYARFEEIQIRERENRTELRAQRQLTDTIEFIDLAPEQRDEVLSRLRQKAKADLQAIPASAALLFDKSILPKGGLELSPDGVLLLAQMGEKVTMEDPMVVYENVMNRHKQELENELKCFDGILTAGQMSQYHAALAEKKETMDRIREKMLSIPRPPEGEQPAAEAIPLGPKIEIVSDDDSQDDIDEEDED